MRKLTIVAVGLALIATTIGQASAGARSQKRAAHAAAMALRCSIPTGLERLWLAKASFHRSEVECTAKARAGSTDMNLDCDDPFVPNNEPDIEVDPTDPQHMVASSNDYDSNGDEFYTTSTGARAG